MFSNTANKKFVTKVTKPTQNKFPIKKKVLKTYLAVICVQVFKNM